MEDRTEEVHPIKKVLVSAAIVAVIVGLMIGVMALGELATNWL
jgi:hypothetical protein